MSHPIRILYVDDYPLDRELVRDALEKELGGFVVTEAASRADFEKFIAAGSYDLVLSDFNILGFEGLQVLETVKARHPGLPVVIVTGTGSEEVAVEAMKRGAMDYVIKSPKHIKKLPATIAAAIDTQRTILERDRLFNLSIDPLCVLGFDGFFRQLNPAWEATLHYPIPELLRKSCRELVHPEDLPALNRFLARLSRGESIKDVPTRISCSDGSYRTFSWNAYPLRDENVAFAVARDVTERQRAEEAIRANLCEKEVLLKEIHHRVKNNLQLVNSLLNLQVQNIGDGEGRLALLESKRRIRSMALVHERLYRSTNLARVDLLEYAKAVGLETRRHYGMTDVDVQVKGIPVELDLDRAVPCGLILSELISNAFKHAFPNGGSGMIVVEVQRAGGKAASITVSDNGVGVDRNANTDQPSTIGLMLVRTLAEQLAGKLSLHRDSGTRWVLEFPAGQDSPQS